MQTLQIYFLQELADMSVPLRLERGRGKAGRLTRRVSQLDILHLRKGMKDYKRGRGKG